MLPHFDLFLLSLLPLFVAGFPLKPPILGPQNPPLQLENPSLLTPPTTDHGDVPNIKWPFSLSHNRITSGGWARGQSVNALPIATALAGVNMRLAAGAVRELHWHNTAEWAYVLKGKVRISTITPEGKVFVGDASEGDLWYFPAGYPHSLQATTEPNGAEFILVFDSGTFSEESTFQLTDWMTHVPKEVLAKNFGVPEREFDRVPEKELFIFPAAVPPADPKLDMVVPNDTPLPFTFALSKVKANRTSGGQYKVADTRTFEVSKEISAVEVVVDVGGMRELHWHPTQPEWTFFISGHARITVFASSAKARTFDFQAGDVAYIPPSFGHYVENLGPTPLKFLEIFKSPIVQDFSLSQWLALTPPNLVKAHLGFGDEMVRRLKKVKGVVVR